MSDREAPSTSVVMATCLQFLLALQTLVVFAAIVFFEGVFNGFGNLFDFSKAAGAGLVFCVPLILIFASALLLSLRKKWGWYLTIAVNLSIETLTAYLIVRQRGSLHISSWRCYLLLDEQILLLGPILLLSQLKARREFLSSSVQTISPLYR